MSPPLTPLVPEPEPGVWEVRGVLTASSCSRLSCTEGKLLNYREKSEENISAKFTTLLLTR